MTDEQYYSKCWLNRMYNFYLELENLISKRERILATLGGVTNYGGGFTARNGNNSDLQLLRFSEVCAEIEKREKQLIAENEKTAEILGKMADFRYRDILNYRYICHMSWRAISEVMKYSEPRIYELHREALAAVYEFIPEKGINYD